MKYVFRSGDSSKKFKIAEGQWYRYAPSYVSPAYHLLEGFPFIQDFFFSSRRRHTIFKCDWSSDVCSSDLMSEQMNTILETISSPPWAKKSSPRSCSSARTCGSLISRSYVKNAPRLDHLAMPNSRPYPRIRSPVRLCSGQYPRPLPHRGQNEQGPRRGSRRGGAPHEERRPESRPQEVSLVAAQAPREPRRGAALPAPRSAPLQPQDRSRLPSQRNFSATLGLQLTRLGRKVPRRMVPSDLALPYRAHEEDRPRLASPPRPHPQLLTRPQHHLQRRVVGAERQ